MKHARGLIALLFVAASVEAFGCTVGGSETPSCAGSNWRIDASSRPVTFSYGAPNGYQFPEYAAIDQNTGYMRLITGPSSTWGTSISLAPSFWSAGVNGGPSEFHLGTPVTLDIGPDCTGDTVTMTVEGTNAGLQFTGFVFIDPPANDQITARVVMAVNNTVALATDKPGEEFQEVFLSTMHDSDTTWDAKSMLIGSTFYPIPNDGKILPTAIQATHFGAIGGTSAWKTNAPTVVIDMTSNGIPPVVNGFVKQSSDNSQDNASVWGAVHDLPSAAWSYNITVSLLTQ